jgi:hypothetical protein
MDAHRRSWTSRGAADPVIATAAVGAPAKRCLERVLTSVHERFEGSHRSRLRWPPIDVSVSSPSRTVTREAERLYDGYLAYAGDARAPAHLHCEVDPDRVRELRSLLAALHRSTVTLDTQDRTTVAMSLVTAGKAAQRSSGIALDFDLGRLLLVPALGAGTRALILREIRALASRQLYAAGWIPVHAAVVVPPGRRALLLTGQKRAGKTATLLHLLEGYGATFVANDKVFVQRTTPVALRALPTAVGVRWDVVDCFPQIKRLAGAGALFHADNLEWMPERHGVPDRLYLPPDILARSFDVPLTREAELGAVVRIAYEARAESIVSRRDDDPRMLLHQHRLDGDPAWCAEWLRGPPQPRALNGTHAFGELDDVAVVHLTPPPLVSRLAHQLDALVSSAPPER